MIFYLLKTGAFSESDFFLDKLINFELGGFVKSDLLLCDLALLSAGFTFIIIII